MDSGVTLLPNERDIQRRYGLTLDQYVELLEAQGGVCAVCGKPPTERTGPLVVDHCHDALTIDGLVHSSPCNRRLLQQVRRYLANPPGRQFGWKVPAELEAQTIATRERAKTAAKGRRAAKRAGRNSEDPGLQNSPSYADQLRDMTRPTDQNRSDELEEPEEDGTDQQEEEAPPLFDDRNRSEEPSWGWSESPPDRRVTARDRNGRRVYLDGTPVPEPERPKRRLRLKFRSGG